MAIICIDVICVTRNCDFARVVGRRNPELYKWFKEFLGHRESGGAVEPVPPAAAKDRGLRNQFSMEIGEFPLPCRLFSFRTSPSTEMGGLSGGLHFASLSLALFVVWEVSSVKKVGVGCVR